MAKKTTNWNRIAGFMAFVAIMIKGVDGILSVFDVDLGVFTQIANIFLVLALVIVGWRFLKTTKLPGKRIVWVVLFWVFVVLALIGPVKIIIG